MTDEDPRRDIDSPAGEVDLTGDADEGLEADLEAERPGILTSQPANFEAAKRHADHLHRGDTR